MKIREKFNSICLKKAKIFWKPFVIFFLFSFLVINWSRIEWDTVLLVSNYKFMSAYLHNALKVNAAEAMGSFGFLKQKNFIEIPALGIKAPIIFSNDVKKKGLEQRLEQGVLHYPFSALPGEQGTALFLGHSAPLFWPDINYDKIFNNLDKLKPEAQIIVRFNNASFIYKVRKTLIIAKNENIIEGNSPVAESILMLITCWPLGNSKQRMIVEAKLE